MIVLALTGFSSGHSHRSHGGHSSDGGGCSSSSRQDHDSSTRVSTSHGGGTHTGEASGGETQRSQPTHRSTPTASPSASARPLRNGTVVLVRCASVDDPYATVEVRNPNTRETVFTAKVSLKARNGFTLIDSTRQVSVPAKSRKTLRMAVASAGGSLDEVDHCEVDPVATADW
ncbi:hypothetical protein AB0D30_38025 [Streptomyces sp. NPDC048409]|uniref:hypothetical protein n=1 Tax=Streptomyces sp. NPDC048409 TaxID=3154723 RepID=UPI00342C09B9